MHATGCSFKHIHSNGYTNRVDSPNTTQTNQTAVLFVSDPTTGIRTRLEIPGITQDELRKRLTEEE
jgi:hypothetical protein